ncbi:MAG: glycosyltransferase family 1 protein [Ruminococcaceae bacterium]|nr:glycosyltransferase family 1 protein [Oscillospiraceae bacterium]
MRVLIFGPKVELGGIETIVLGYAEQLIKNGCKCDFLLYKNCPVLEEKIKAIGGNCVFAASRRVNYAQYNLDLNNIFKTKYTAVWCNFDGLTNIDLLKRAKKAGVPLRIVHSHTSALPKVKSYMKILVPLLHYFNKPFIDKYATEFWACSLKSGHFMYPKKLWNKIKIWNNCINPNLFNENPQKREQLRRNLSLNGKLVIGHIGRICFEKNQYFLLRVYKELLSRRNDVHLLFLSDSPNNALIDYAAKLEIVENITFLTGEFDLPMLYNAMDVFFLPSIIEGLPLVALEAQACGVPCVISTGVSRECDVSGFVDFLPLENDISIWCEALEKAAQKRIINPTEAISSHNFNLITEGSKMFDFMRNAK